MRKSQKRFLIIIVLAVIFFILFICNLKVQANTNNEFELKEFSEEFMKYLELPEEERKNLYAPRPYDIEEATYVPNNQLKIMRTIGATYSKKYSLRQDIPDNLEIKDQKSTNMCWAFSALSSLETYLALSDINNNRAKKVYDFSERHMEYATVRELGGEINIYGFNRTINSGGLNINKQDISYLTNGMGAISEEEMPFSEDMSMKNLSYIQNKKVLTQVYDIVEFSNNKTDELMDQMKNHIKNYGSINVNIFGASPNKEFIEKDGKVYYCYNNATGAIYCDRLDIFQPNHAVSLIGWDDDYAVENFNVNNRPSGAGAWIVRNSWGKNRDEKVSYAQIKREMYEKYYRNGVKLDELKIRLEEENLNWTSVEDITDKQAEKFASSLGYEKDSTGQFYLKVGDNGIMYISYYDCNVYSYMTGIEKAETKIKYDNIYQYDELGTTAVIKMQNPNNYKAWIGNVFEKDANKTEYLTQVAIYAPEKYTCKVWVNPEGESRKRDELVEAKLKEGETETFEPGYHTIEFAEPIELKADKFFVALQIELPSQNGNFEFAVEGLWNENIDNNRWNCVQKETNKTFMALEGEDRYFDAGWRDISTIEAQYLEKYWIKGGDSTLKAFTTDTIKDDTIKEIKVTTPPNKTEYFAGESFDKTGMVVTGYLNNGDTIEINDYIISDGEKLGINQDEVTIKYEKYITIQKIEVTKNSVEKLVIKQVPKKLEYDAGDDFDPEGMIVEVTFKDGSVKEVTDFEIPDGKDLKNGQTTVKVVYQEGNETLEIKVNPNPVVDLNVTTMPSKTEYVEGQDFDTKGMVVTVTYQNGKVKNVTSYTVENGTKLTKGQNKVIVKFEDKSYEVEITVKEKKPLGIDIKTAPTKLKYTQYKEELDVKGGVITVKYNDGSSEEVAMTTSGVTFEGFDNTKLGKNTITVKYLNLEKTFEVEIIEETKDLPENSDFSKAISKNKLMKMYYYTNNTEKNYAEITVEISGITKATVNDSLSYKYYLSSNQAEKTISDEKWVELKNVQITDGKLRFTINTKDLTNYDEVSKSNNLYLYVREIATRNGQTKVLDVNAKDISKPEQKEEYIDGIKKENPSGGGISKPGDDSQASGKYPYTGKKVMILIGFILITLGVFGFIRYKNIDK